MLKQFSETPTSLNMNQSLIQLNKNKNDEFLHLIQYLHLQSRSPLELYLFTSVCGWLCHFVFQHFRIIYTYIYERILYVKYIDLFSAGFIVQHLRVVVYGIKVSNFPSEFSFSADRRQLRAKKKKKLSSSLVISGIFRCASILRRALCNSHITPTAGAVC